MTTGRINQVCTTPLNLRSSTWLPRCAQAQASGSEPIFNVTMQQGPEAQTAVDWSTHFDAEVPGKRMAAKWQPARTWATQIMHAQMLCTSEQKLIEFGDPRTAQAGRARRAPARNLPHNQPKHLACRLTGDAAFCQQLSWLAARP